MSVCTYECVCVFMCVYVRINSEVGGSLGGESLDAVGVAVLAKNMTIQWVTALIITLREQTATILTAVTLHMEIPVQGHYADGLLLARSRHYGLFTHRATRGKLLVEVLDAVDVVGGVHGEGDAVQAPVTHHTGKAVWVVSFTRRPQNTLHDGLTADVTGLQGVDVARLTVSLLVHSIEGFASQLAAAGHANKAIHMKDLIHGSAASSFTNHVLPTAGTATKVFH